uniref:Uncharacterized protein n=1 Tax=Oryza rufipogon TaxID=4529 RepID=A0A0E0RBB4_ORYRU
MIPSVQIPSRFVHTGLDSWAWCTDEIDGAPAGVAPAGNDDDLTAGDRSIDCGGDRTQQQAAVTPA